ncbi:MAG: VWA domain-containing protein [Anaerolineales bacterium]|nr:VWA domain-containing protein [Anaerolineales bacterium]
MSVHWLAPAFLWLGALPLLLLALYLGLLRRRRRYAVRFSSLALVRAARPRLAWRRHLPFALFLLAVAALTLTLARPATVAAEPVGEATILLALDISESMCATDIAPNRLAAAQAAAERYINSQGPGARIGLVAFAGFAQVIQRPTTNHAQVQAALRSLVTSRGTAVGDGLAAAVDAIAALAPDAPPPPAGTYPPEIVVLLTDGVTTLGQPPLEAAGQAVRRGIRVFTIGFGTPSGGDAAECAGGASADPGDEALPTGETGLDEATLRQVAEVTGGAYYTAASADELQAVFRDLPTAFTTVSRTHELTVYPAAVGALLAALALLAAALWQPLL